MEKKCKSRDHKEKKTGLEHKNKHQKYEFEVEEVEERIAPKHTGFWR
ncbi:MAG: hypothetical protein HYU64_02005 [Armatimonadetes bacterium]|nr:hypothetical protein [Armatimonadota bacterium]